MSNAKVNLEMTVKESNALSLFLETRMGQDDMHSKELTQILGQIYIRQANLVMEGKIKAQAVRANTFYNLPTTKKEGTKMFAISQEKLEEITRIVNQEFDPKATEKLIESEICADWHESKRHQEWINEASPQEIADWLATFYS